MTGKSAGLIYGPLEHHLDHLAPFCSLMEIPLILTDEDLYQKARLYYPELHLIFFDCLEAPFEIVKAFETIFYSTPRSLFDDVFFIAETTLRKKIKTIWLPHGNSDKGHSSRLMEGLKDEKSLLVYGPKMIDFISQKTTLPPHIQIGNFRLEYYRRHRLFYAGWMEKLQLPSQFILYAPTWQDGENSSSFFEMTQHLIEQADQFLVIKLHPNLEKNVHALQLMLQNENRSHVRFLTGFPPVYPLLERASVYLGDMSSIGYDFLSFNRPMFFFNPAEKNPTDPGLYLHRCGLSLKLPSLLFLNNNQSHLRQLRQETYAYTFGEDRPWEQIRAEIEKNIR